ncbi:MAG: hypothetical protein RIC33_23960 [Gimesia maris]
MENRGEIEQGKVYTIERFMEVSGIKRFALDAARRNGLTVRKLGRRCLSTVKISLTISSYQKPFIASLQLLVFLSLPGWCQPHDTRCRWYRQIKYPCCCFRAVLELAELR